MSPSNYILLHHHSHRHKEEEEEEEEEEDDDDEDKTFIMFSFRERKLLINHMSEGNNCSCLYLYTFNAHYK